MLGNFSYYNPTKLYFGDESLNFLKDELNGYGPVVIGHRKASMFQITPIACASRPA